MTLSPCFSSCPLAASLRCAVPATCLLTNTNSSSARLSWSLLLTKPGWFIPELPRIWFSRSNYCVSPSWQWQHPNPPRVCLATYLESNPSFLTRLFATNGCSVFFSSCHSGWFNVTYSNFSPLLPVMKNPLSNLAKPNKAYYYFSLKVTLFIY